MKKLILFVLFISISTFFAQRNFTFNLPGNECYFNYICYSQTNEYNSPRHPFIFVLGKSGESAQQTFDSDTLKKLPKFFNYKFVYIPNDDLSSKKELDCIYALVGLVTYNYAFGKDNLFFQVNDKNVSKNDLIPNGLNAIFKSVRLSNSEIDTNKKDLAKNDISEDFKETVIDYDNQKDADKFGTFYEDAEPTAGEQDPASQVAQKAYFGPPENFNYNLTGIIRDRSTGEALPFASIQVKGTTKGATSNPDGYFTLLKVPSDTSVLVVQYVGYDKTEIYLTPSLPKSNFVIEVNPANNLKTITVTTYKEDVVLTNKTDVSTIKMTPKKLEQLPNIGERDIMRSFQLMPGVSASNESSSGLYVRGGTPDQNLVLYDGFTVYQVDHLYGFFSAFNSNALKDVQLHKGGYESKFGGRLSSVTEITSKDGNQNKFNIGGDLSLLSTNIFAEVPIGKKFSSIVAFRRSYQGPIYNLIFREFNNTQAASSGGRFSQNTTVKSFFYDLNGKFTYRPNDKDIISLSIYNGTDKLDNSSSSGNRSFGNASNTTFSFNSSDLTKYGNIGSSLKWSRKWRPRFYGNTILSYSNYYSNRNKSSEVTLTRSTGETSTTNSGIFENNDLKDYSAKSDYQWDIFRFSQLQFGAYATAFDIKYNYSQNDTVTILDRHDMSVLAGGYIQSNTKLFKDRVHFVPGIRTSYFKTTGQLYYEPRASLTISLTDQLTLKGATGKYYQFANRVTREDILAGSRDFWILSDNKKVPVSSSIHYIAGLSYETKNFLFSTEGYYKKLDGLTEYSLRFNASPSGTNYNENFFNGYGFSRGVEFLLQKKSGKFNGWVSYTLGQARNHFDVYGDGYYPANQDVTHEFKIVLLYKYKRWDFSATWIYATGRPYTAPSGAYDVTLLDGSSQSFFTVTTKNGLRLPDYHRADVSANYKLLAGEKGNKKRREVGYIGFSIFNVYNHVNVWYKQYAIENGTILETNVNYLGLVPNVTLSLKLR